MSPPPLPGDEPAARSSTGSAITSGFAHSDHQESANSLPSYSSWARVPWYLMTQTQVVELDLPRTSPVSR
ncbi:hypothetical protein ADK67_14940 [Saccharothrix sp. NRRL B-16348]|nr:hypothetical protein ADK67_14940 [Saccharothrix sp. NRRL B-16348]